MYTHTYFSVLKPSNDVISTSLTLHCKVENSVITVVLLQKKWWFVEIDHHVSL